MVDMSHKLCTFILKEHKKLKAQEKKDGKSKKEKKKEKKEKKEKKKKKDKKKKKKKKDKKSDDEGEAEPIEVEGGFQDEDGEIWHTDISAEAVKERRR